jgi:ATP-dependent helicase/DNAse subunit B
MSLTKDLNFSRYAKVLTTNEMNILKDIAEKNIKEASTKIINTEFNIEPKKIGDINYGCEYCKYKDICYHTPKDIVELKELTKEDIFGGEE